MAESGFYTKGDKESIIGRIDQVHTITMFCPIRDTGVQYLMNAFQLILTEYRVDEYRWKDVPTIDALKVFLFAKSMMDIEVKSDAVGIIAASLKAFIKLKYINFEFTDNPDVANAYDCTVKNKKKEILKNIYRVDVLELNLSDMFSQEVIDHFNKVLVINEIIPNSYLDRVLRIDFKYDEYVSFMDMFLGNYGPALNQRDSNTCDYFRSFPPLIDEQKPEIRVITNYSDL